MFIEMTVNFKCCSSDTIKHVETRIHHVHKDIFKRVKSSITVFTLFQEH